MGVVMETPKTAGEQLKELLFTPQGWPEGSNTLTEAFEFVAAKLTGPLQTRIAVLEAVLNMVRQTAGYHQMGNLVQTIDTVLDKKDKP